MLKIFKYLKLKEWLLILVSTLFIAGQVYLDLKIPDYMKEITILIQTPGSTVGKIWQTGSFMLLCALGSLASSIIVGFFAARIAATLSRRLRSLQFETVESFSLEEINRFSTASLITRSTNDITQVQMFVAMGLQIIVKAPIMAVWAIAKIAGKSWQWTGATAIAVAVLLILVVIIVTIALPKFRKIQSLTDNLNRVTRENLTGLRVVRAYNAEEYEENKFDKANVELTDTYLFTTRMMAIMMPGMHLIMNGLNLSIYWIGAYLVAAAGMMDRLVIFSDMIVFSAYAMQVVMAFVMLTMIFIMLPRASVAAKRIMEVINTRPSITDGTISPPAGSASGEIEFRNVGFKYPGAAEYVLENISFKVQKGETVAFIGSTGSGKSTLINLVPRFYDATEGEVLVNGINVKDYPLKELYNKLGYIPQRAVLFSGTIKSNVAYGDNGGEQPHIEDIKKAMEIAQGTEFVEKMEGGYDAPISQGGINVSGGQKQRIAIARAISRKPEILIFDDSFSALDYKTDRQLRRALKKETADITSLIVATRIGTIKDADKIVVLEEGKTVGIGTHRELMQSCEVYREIAYSQMTREELEND
jgi:ATP-binding cassette subfamily B protein